MAIDIVGIHHHAIRIKGDPADLAKNLDFYQGLLGLEPDAKRPDLRGVPGFWINVGASGQLHLIGGPVPSPFAQGPGRDPVLPHVALAVSDIRIALSELDRRGVEYWRLGGAVAPQSVQLFLNDPNGYVVELHQFDQCRCIAENRSQGR
jgi:catechol 2,3-dioxygenase-like lactoylglutathione lyase family enzyme